MTRLLLTPDMPSPAHPTPDNGCGNPCLLHYKNFKSLDDKHNSREMIRALGWQIIPNKVILWSMSHICTIPEACDMATAWASSSGVGCYPNTNQKFAWWQLRGVETGYATVTVADRPTPVVRLLSATALRLPNSRLTASPTGSGGVGYQAQVAKYSKVQPLAYYQESNPQGMCSSSGGDGVCVSISYHPHI